MTIHLARETFRRLLVPSLCAAFVFCPAVPAGAACAVGGTPTLPAPEVEWLRGYQASFQSPTRLAVDASGRVYVADPAAGRVLVRAADGRIATVGEGLGHPVSVAVSGDGSLIYVGDGAGGRVTAYAPDWQPVLDLGQGDGEFGFPSDIALAPATGDVWVADSVENRVEVYDASGTALFGFGGRGADEGLFQSPAGIFVDDVAGEVLVVDQLNGRIQVFDTSGAFLSCFGDKGSGNGELNMPQGIWVDGLGRIFVADAFEGWVHVIDRLGATVALLGDVNDIGVGPGQLTTPSDLVIDPSGRLFVSSSTTGRVEIFGLDVYADPEAFVPARVEVLPDPFDRLVAQTATALIEAPGYDLDLLDLDSITASGVPAVPGSGAIGDADGDGVPDASVVFDGQQLAAVLPVEGEATVRVAGPMGALEVEGFDSIAVFTSPDGDGDGVPDGTDVCPGFDDTLDADADGVPDACDLCPGFDDAPDGDADGVPDGCDLCPGFPDTPDTDADGVPDSCERCPGFDDGLDGDGDGVPDGCDLCPGFPDGLDADRDGVPDGCDLCQGQDASGDGDGDGVCADLDCDDADPDAQEIDGCGICGGDGSTCSIFFDDFESGDTAAWSGSVP